MLRVRLLLGTSLLLLQACAQTPAPPVSDNQPIEELQQQIHSTSADLNKKQRQILRAQKKQQAAIAELAKKLDEKPAPIVSVTCPPTTQEMRCPDTKPVPVINDKLVVGAIEKVRLHPSDAALSARIDTGATSASLDAQDIEKFERDGEDWVRFKIPLDDERTEFKTVEKKVLHWVNIIQSSSDEANRRPVVRLKFDIGPISQYAEFNLSDREHLTFPILIGRNILKDIMVVDVSKEYSLKLAPPSEGQSPEEVVPVEPEPETEQETEATP